MGGYAWVTLATNNSYSLGALVLAHSLKKSNTAHKMVVLITSAVSESMRNHLSTVFDVVKLVDVLDSKDEAHLALMQRPELGITFTKIHCWRLIEFEKCVFLDADTLVVRNCDELFEREEFSAAPDASWPDCFNSGVFVFRPSVDTFNKIIQFAVENKSFDGGDQGLLNQFFSNWATEDIKKHLPFVYNLTSIGSYAYIPAFKHYGVETRIVHFIGTGKPWLQQLDIATKTVAPSSGYEHLTPLLQQWWDIFCEKVHPTLDKNLESSNEGMSHSPIEACSNSLPIALTDEPQTLRLIPCTPHREKVVTMHNLSFNTNDSSGELLQPPVIVRESETRSKPTWREVVCRFQSAPERVEKECKKCTETPMRVEERSKEEEIEQQPQEEPPPKDPFDYESFFPDESCIKTYLEQNVMTYQPFESQEEIKPPDEPELLPRFLTIPEDDKRQSGNFELPIEKHEPQRQQTTEETRNPIRREEPPREILTKSKSMPFLPLEVTPEIPNPPRSIWKSQPNVNVDPNKKYSMPKLKPIIPKQNSRFVLTKIPKVTHYTEFLMSSEYKDPVNLPKDRIGFVATQLHTQKHKRNKTNARTKFGPLPFIQSPEMDKPACKKIRLEHSDDDLYDLTQCKRQSGNKPKPKDVYRKPNGNNLEEILSRLKEFSKDYQHYFGIAPKPMRRTVMCKNAVVQASGEGECRMSEAFKTILSTVCSWSRGTQTLGPREEFRLFRNYVKDQNEASQKGLLIISGKNATPSPKHIEEEGEKSRNDNILKGNYIADGKNIRNTDNRKVESLGARSEHIDDAMRAKSNEVLMKLSQLEISKDKGYGNGVETGSKNQSKVVVEESDEALFRLKKLEDGVDEESLRVVKKHPVAHSKYSLVENLGKSRVDDVTKPQNSEVSLKLQQAETSQDALSFEPSRVQLPQSRREEESVVHFKNTSESVFGEKLVDDVTADENKTVPLKMQKSENKTNAVSAVSSVVQGLHSRNEKESIIHFKNQSGLDVEDKQQDNVITVQNEALSLKVQETESVTDGVSVESSKVQMPHSGREEEPALHPKTEEKRSSDGLIIPQNNAGISLKLQVLSESNEYPAAQSSHSSNDESVVHSENQFNSSIEEKQSSISDDVITGNGCSLALQQSDEGCKMQKLHSNSVSELNYNDDVTNGFLSSTSDKQKALENETAKKNFFKDQSQPEEHLTDDIKKSEESKLKSHAKGTAELLKSGIKPENRSTVPVKNQTRGDDVTTSFESKESTSFASSELLAQNGPIQNEEKVKKPEEILCVPDFETPRSSRVTSKTTEDEITLQKPRKCRSSPKKVHKRFTKNSPDESVRFSGKKNSTAGNDEREGVNEKKDRSGIAGAIAQLSLQAGEEQTAESTAASTAHQEYLRRQNWETGNIDYMGRDSFDNIWSKICQTLESKEQEPPKAEAVKKPSETLSKVPEYIETLPGKPAPGPVEDDEIIFSKPDSRQSGLINISEEDEAGGENVKLSDILGEGKVGLGEVKAKSEDVKPVVSKVKSESLVSSPQAKPQPAGTEVKTETTTAELKAETKSALTGMKTQFENQVPIVPGVKSEPLVPSPDVKSQSVTTEINLQPTATAGTEIKPQTPATEGKSQPVITEAKPQTPSTEAKPQTPVAEAKPQPVTAEVKPQTPSTEAKPQPETAEAKSQTVTTEAKPKTPSTEAKPQTPVAEAKPQPVTAEVKPQTVTTEAKPQTPSTEAKPQTPATEGKSQPVTAAAKPQTPSTEAKPQTPSTEAKPQTPVAEAKPQPVTAEVKPQTVTTEAKPKTPATEAKPKTPATEAKPKTPSAEAKPQTPPTEAKPQTPVAEAKPQTPATEAKPQTPVAEAKPQPVTAEAKSQTPATEAKPQMPVAEAKSPLATTEVKSPAAETKTQPSKTEFKPTPALTDIKPQLPTDPAKVTPHPDASNSTTKPTIPQIPIIPTTEPTGECKVVAIPSPPILPAETHSKGKKAQQKPQVQLEPIPLPPPDSPSSEQPVKTSRSDSLKDEGKQKKGVFTKILEMVGVKEKNGNEENKSVFYDVEGGEKEMGVEAVEQEVKKEEKNAAGETQRQAKEGQKLEMKEPGTVQPISKPERSSKDAQQSTQVSGTKRKSQSPKLTMPQTPETAITTPTPPPSQENPPRKNSALLKVEETILETPPVPEPSNVQTEVEDIIGKAKTEVETLLQDKETSEMINTMKLIMGEEQEEVEELKVTTEEERKRHKAKGEVVSSKLSDQILKAIPPPRRKAISDATASTSAIPEQKSPQTAEGKNKSSKGSSIPVPPPRNKGKPQPPPSKGKGKK